MGGTTRISEDVVGTLTLHSSAYGLTVPIVGGVFKVGGNLVDYLDFKSQAHTEEQGGKGGGVENTSYTYSVSLLMGLGMGRLNVGRVFKGKEVNGAVFGSMARQASTITVPASGAMTFTLPNGQYLVGDAFVTYSSGGKLAVLSSGVDYKVEGSTLTILNEKWRGKSLGYGFSVSNWTPSGLTEIGLSLKNGDISQTPPSWISASSDPSHSQNYPGLAYVNGEDYALGNSTSVENHSFEVAGFGAGRYFATAPESAKLDCNTAEFVAWVLSAADFGAGVPAERLDVKAWIDYVAAAGLLSSPALTTATKAADLLKRACDLTNTVAVPSYDRIKLLPLCDVEVTGNGVTYTPDNTIRFDVNADWIIGEVEINRKQKSDRFNHFRVEYKDRGSQYAPAIAEAMDDEDIALNGKRTGDTISAPWVCSADVARLIAQIALQRSMQVNATGRVVLPFAFSMLEPGGLITITDPRRGLDRLPVRVTATSDNGRRVTVEFEEWPLGVASPAQYQQEVPAGFLHDYSAAPSNVDAPVIFEGPAQLASPTGVEVHVAVRGTAAAWGGAHVYVSYDGTQYKQIGTVYGSRYGLINGSVSSGAASFAVDGMGSGQLLNGSAEDAQNLETLCYLGGSAPEFLAYQTATLTGAGAYTLSGLVRGAYGSGAQAHADNVPFVRMDGTTARSGSLSPDLIGQTVYIKCLSFNIYNRATQSLADATAYSYTITGKPASYLPGIAGKGLTAKSSSLTFTLQKTGGVTPSSVTLTAERKGGLEGVVNWSVVSGTATLSASTGDSVTLSSGNLATDLATVRATVTDSVAAYTSDVTISKVREGEDGAPGAPGNYIDHIFIRSAAPPSTPSGSGLPSGWADAPPVGPDPLYMSVAEKTAAGALVGTWGNPVRLDGQPGTDGQSVSVEYSVDGSTSWHPTFAGGDKYMRQRIGAGAWSAAIKIVGENGAQGPQGLPGANGTNGASAPLLVLLATAQTFAYDSAGSPKPAGQVITLTASLQNVSGTATFTARLYNAAGTDIGALSLGGGGNTRTIAIADFGSAASASITATLSGLSDTTSIVRVQDGANGANGANGTPGANGQDAIVSDLTNDSHTLPATSAGVVTSYDGAATAMVVYRGTTVDTGNWSFSKTDGPNVTSTLSGNVVTITSLAAAVESGYVDITATRSGYPTQNKRFTLAKSRSAVGTSGLQAGWYIGAYATDFTAPYSMTATVTFQTTGVVQATATNQATQTGYWYSPSTSGIGSSYWIKVTKLSGNTPTGSALGTWLQLSSDRSFTLSGSSNALGQYAVKIATSASDSAIVGSGFFDLGNDNGA